MQPVYIKKADPRDRTTWIDKFIAGEANHGFRAVVELALKGSAPIEADSIFNLPSVPRRDSAAA
jgi:hypothetical protein